MGTPEDRLVLKGTESLTLEERGAIVHLPLAVLELDGQCSAGPGSDASGFRMSGCHERSNATGTQLVFPLFRKSADYAAFERVLLEA